MKIKLFYKSTFVLFISLFLFSCNSDHIEDKKPPKVEKAYLVDFKKVEETKQFEIFLIAEGLKIYSKNKDVPVKEITHDVETYVIKYNTTFQGKEIVASGLVLIPIGGETFPILSFQNGTNVEHSKAPSVNYNSMYFQMFNVMSSTGFIVSVPDYLGFGASKDMFHPYLHKKSTVQSMVDMLKAVRELTNGEKVAVKSSKDVYLSGYSQGGWSTMCLQKALELDYSEEFTVKASSCGAGPYNLETVIKEVLKKDYYNNPFFLAYVFNAMNKMEEVSKETINKIVRKPYADKMTNLFDGVKTGDEINAELSRNVKEVFTDNFIKNYATSADFKDVRNFLQKNSVDFWKTNIPTKLFHGTADNDVPFATSKEAYNEMKKLGVKDVTLQLVPIKNKNHVGAIIPVEIATLQWFLEIKNK
ncbi:MAG: alpha/beta hydrolase [Flavobacteriaceae bacterium]|nr:alpha/beta hydrolase [Flavobacteriaceae bacterium]